MNPEVRKDSSRHLDDITCPVLVHLRKIKSAAVILRYAWPAVLYRCPDTGLNVNVQGWLADDAAPNEGEVYEAMRCPACTRVHLVNPATGRVLGAEE